jgi:hypothetical protein
MASDDTGDQKMAIMSSVERAFVLQFLFHFGRIKSIKFAKKQFKSQGKIACQLASL